MTASVTHGRVAHATPKAPRAASYTTTRDTACLWQRSQHLGRFLGNTAVSRKERNWLVYLSEVRAWMRVGGESNRSTGRIIRKNRKGYRTIHWHGVRCLRPLGVKNLLKIGLTIKGHTTT